METPNLTENQQAWRHMMQLELLRMCAPEFWYNFLREHAAAAKAAAQATTQATEPEIEFIYEF